MIALSGVRSSWLILARELDFVRLANATRCDSAGELVGGLLGEACIVLKLPRKRRGFRSSTGELHWRQAQLLERWRAPGSEDMHNQLGGEPEVRRCRGDRVLYRTPQQARTT